jgi:ACS family tartrate transporter-like MFS transporter
MSDLGAPGALPTQTEARAAMTLNNLVLRKVAWRLLPFLCLLYLLNILDRANVGFARLTMQRDLELSNQAFNIGYGIFYIGYLVFEVPANLLLHRIGARRWIARIMVSWGLVTCATFAVTDKWSFYAVRILLGIAEAGFFPGIVFYLSSWFPARERARAMALFMIASALAGVFGNPLSGAIMQYLHGVGGLVGWQWLFILQGLPAVLLGIIVLWYLPDSPASAAWLNPAERAWLNDRLAADAPTHRSEHRATLLHAASDPRVWLLICIYFTVAVGSNASGAHFPKLIGDLFRDERADPRVVGAGIVGWASAVDGSGALMATVAPGLEPASNALLIGLLAALPHVCAVVAMIVIGTHSDRTGERRGHVAFSAFLGAVGWLLAMVSPWPWLTLAGFCVAQAGMMSMLPTFWAIPTAFLTGAGAAGGIALINSVANIGGFIGPQVFEVGGMPAIAIILVIGGILAVAARGHRGPQQAIVEPQGKEPAKG